MIFTALSLGGLGLTILVYLGFLVGLTIHIRKK